MAADLVFIDTNVLVAASVAGHPSHAVAQAFLARLTDAGGIACISSQVCREFLVVLTRGVLQGRSFTVTEALEVLDEWRSNCTVLDENDAVLPELLELVRRHEVKGKQIHDANIVATMQANAIARLATLNAADFKRYEGAVLLESLVS